MIKNMGTEQELDVDTIHFRFRDGCLNTIRDIMFNHRYILASKGAGVYESVSDNRRGHEIRVDIYSCTVSFHYNDPSARDKEKGQVGRVRQMLLGKLEVVE